MNHPLLTPVTLDELYDADRVAQEASCADPDAECEAISEWFTVAASQMAVAMIAAGETVDSFTMALGWFHQGVRMGLAVRDARELNQ